MPAMNIEKCWVQSFPNIMLLLRDNEHREKDSSSCTSGPERKVKLIALCIHLPLMESFFIAVVLFCIKTDPVTLLFLSKRFQLEQHSGERNLKASQFNTRRRSWSQGWHVGMTQVFFWNIPGIVPHCPGPQHPGLSKGGMKNRGRISPPLLCLRLLILISWINKAWRLILYILTYKYILSPM